MKHFSQQFISLKKKAADFQRQTPKCKQASLKVKADTKTHPRLNKGRLEFGPVCDGFHSRLLAHFTTPLFCIMKERLEIAGLGKNPNATT